jgi:hypothetical protein
MTISTRLGSGGGYGRCEKCPDRSGVASRRQVDVNDLVELIHCPVEAAPSARDLHPGLVAQVVDRSVLTDELLGEVLAALASQGVSTTGTMRVTDRNIRPGVTSDERDVDRVAQLSI